MRAWPVSYNGTQRTGNGGERWPISSRLPPASQLNCRGAVLVSQRRVSTLYSERRIVRLIAPCR
jgi:hypothetical protein